MRTPVLLLFLLCMAGITQAQKKPLDHSVYDGWQSISERAISNNGQFTIYTINPQEGDGTLVIQATDHSWKKEIARGYNAVITEDNRFVICRIKPFFKDTRDARIKKKTPNDMPKDSLGIIEIGKDSVTRIPRLKSYRVPDKGEGVWLAYQLEKAPETAKARQTPDSLARVNSLLRMADSLARVADSIRNKANEVKTKGLAVLESPKKESKPAAKPRETIEEGTELVLRNLLTGEEKKYALVNDYYFSEKGNRLVVRTTRKNADTLLQALVLYVNTANGKTDTIMRGVNDARNFAFDEAENQLCFVAERDSATKALQKFYKLWYYKAGMDSARLRVNTSTPGVAKGLTVSENATLVFSKDGKKLFFGLTPIRKPKDTTLVDFETARLDVWHYNDDYLQPQQLVQLTMELRKSFTAVLHGDDDKVIQLGDTDRDLVTIVDEGNADYVLAASSKGNRVETQWQGFARQTAWIVSTTDGSKKLVKEKNRGMFTISPKGRYVIWYDIAAKQYFTYEVATGTTRNITQKITTPLYDDEDDHPDDPPSWGITGWVEDDASVLVNDRYDMWLVDPAGIKPPVNMTAGYGRQHKTVFRYLRTDREARFIKKDEVLVLSGFNRINKYDGFFRKQVGVAGAPELLHTGPYATLQLQKAKKANQYLFAKMSVQEPPDVYASADLKSFTKLSALNPQQKEYNWLTAELVKWKMFDGKEAEGLLFKPENFDPKKKYPVIFYFYEKNADNLHVYRAPSPSASTVNIAYFVSNGYLVFDPNIYYKNGEPGESAYNSVVSAAKYMAKMPWVDSTKMAIQGQSWGGYQVAYLVTRTKMFAAAGAGAPVANMTSAYGGIRWGTGLNRQFQYERSQSRIGASLWQKPELYIKNSPLFKADKVTTPLLIMHNDADGAVPWYQGIEYFTALRRLGKKVWMLQYNGEDHNLVERRNRKDLSIRLAQFFDYHLKGAPPAKWIAEGVPATQKGIEWGTQVEEKKGF
jgi:dipeptidyl aminopeptidase/acylaminoacyl peptidase